MEVEMPLAGTKEKKKKKEALKNYWDESSSEDAPIIIEKTDNDNQAEDGIKEDDNKLANDEKLSDMDYLCFRT